MKTYSESEVFSKEDVENYQHATKIVDLLPDTDTKGRILRCHEVARVVGKILGLPVEDGKFEVGVEHSWCPLPSRHILDVYTVGRLPPVQLVACVSSLPNRFTAKNIDLEVREDVVDHLVRLVVATLARMDGQHERTGG